MNDYKFKLFESESMSEDKFDEWESYRLHIRNKISKELNQQNDSIVLFGAGECNDLDLQYFESRFNKVTLVDINTDLMEKALKKHGIEKSNKVQLVKSDFVGITDNEYMKYEDMLKSGESIKKIGKYIRTLSQKIETTEIDLNLENQQVGICLGVHSQLIIKFKGTLLYYNHIYNKKEIKKINDELEYMNLKIAIRLNRTILNTTYDKIFLGFDMMELSHKWDTIKYIPSIYEYTNKGDFIGLHNNIVRYHLVDGSSQGYDDISNKIINEQVTSNSLFYITWPFSVQKFYLVYLLALSK